MNPPIFHSSRRIILGREKQTKNPAAESMSLIERLLLFGLVLTCIGNADGDRQKSSKQQQQDLRGVRRHGRGVGECGGLGRWLFLLH